jgi:hypothetical protein
LSVRAAASKHASASMGGKRGMRHCNENQYGLVLKILILLSRDFRRLREGAA